MKYNFDEPVNRLNTYSMKWDGVPLFRLQGMEDARWDEDTIPMMVADMDFKCPPALQAAMHRVADHGIYGYTLHLTDPLYNKSIVSWYKRRYDTEIKEDWILYSNGSVSGINCAMNAFLNPGDGVIITPPVYGHFNGMIDGETCHKVVHSTLINTDGYYTMDWEDFEKKCAVPTNRMFILCSPANPIGRVWTPEELSRMAEICRKHHVLLVSDEIHSDILREGVTHTPILKATDDHSNIILVIGINKSFNVAGLHCSNMVIPNENLREIFRSQFGMKMPTPFTVAAQIAAYEECEDWLDELNTYIDGNIDFAIDFMNKHMPKVKVWRPEGGYMLWLDFRAYGLSGDEVHRLIYDEANVILQDGIGHDPGGGECFQRMIITLPRAQLELALRRIARQFNPDMESDEIMRLKTGDVLPDFTFNTPFNENVGLYDSIGDKPAVLLFLRYYGCSICQLDIRRLKEQYESIAPHGKVLVVLQSDPAALKETLSGENPFPFDIICDPDQKLYKQLAITPAKGKLGLLGKQTLKKIAEARKLHIEHGAYEGDEQQLPATFGIMPGGRVFYAHYGNNAGDTPEPAKLTEILSDAK